MSYRRTNEPGGLEVEPSTAGASGAGDHDPEELYDAARKAEEEFADLMFEADPSIRPKGWKPRKKEAAV